MTTCYRLLTSDTGLLVVSLTCFVTGLLAGWIARQNWRGRPQIPQPGSTTPFSNYSRSPRVNKAKS